MAERLLQTLLVNSLVFAALFAAVALVRALLGRRLSAGLSLALWAVLAVKLLLPFGFQSALSPLVWLRPAAVAPVAQPAATAATSAAASPATAMAVTGSSATAAQPSGSLSVVPIHNPAQPQLADAEEGRGTSLRSGQSGGAGVTGLDGTLPGQGSTLTPVTSTAPALWSRVSWYQWLLLAWASGAVGVALWLALGHLALRRHLRAGLAAPPAAVQALRDCCRELGIRRLVGLKLLRGGGSPAIAGLLRPVVLVDEALAQDAAALRPVLLHELFHCHSGDLWAIFGLNLLTVVYWFHPLVWVLAALARRDMETRCDQRVLACLSREDQQGYVNTLLHFAGYGWALKPQAALGMGVSRKTMERRIRDMFRSRRADGLTRWVSAGCAALLLCVGLLSACVPPTATVPLALAAALPAGTTAPDSAATAATMPSATTAPEVDPALTPAAAPTATPPHRTQSYPGAEDPVTITVDADILQPSTALPIVRLAPRDIPMDQVRRMAQVLFDGKPACEPQVGLNKAQLQAIIGEYQAIIADRDKLVAENGGGKQGEAAADSLIRDYNKSLKTYQKQLPAAPEVIPRKLTDWTFHAGDYYRKMAGLSSDTYDRNAQRICMEADLDGGYTGNLSAFTYSTDITEQRIIGFDLGSVRSGANTPTWKDADTRPMTMSADQAVAMVQDKLQAMGIQGYALSSLQPQGKAEPVQVPPEITDPAKRAIYIATGMGQPAATAGPEQSQQVFGYSMVFLPTYGGIPQAECLTYGMARDKSAVGPGYGYERLRVWVKNDRIVSLSWSSPTQPEQIEEASAKLLPIDDILAAFQAYMQRTVNRAWLTHESPDNPGYKERLAALAGGGVRITRIQLELYRMRDKDHKLTFRTMPVWRFYGQQSTRFTDGTSYNNQLVGGYYISEPDGGGLSLVATINAVDGCLFNEYKGY